MPWLQTVLDVEINDKISSDARTTSTTFLGWPKKTVFTDVIEGGQADFDAPIGHLTGADRALLYAKYNQVRHLDELRHAFRQLFQPGLSYGDPIMIDLGCGPFTAGLSLAATLGKNDVFDYYGVDHYQSMRDLGLQLANAARAHGALHDRTKYQFLRDLNQVNFGPIRGSLTLFVASYLLASPNLNIENLVLDMINAHTRASMGPAVVLYTNSARAEARAKFPEFKRLLIEAGFNLVIDHIDRFTETTKAPTDVHYALFFKPANFSIRRDNPL